MARLLPIPINLDTVNKLYGLNLTSFEMENFLESVAEKKERDQDLGRCRGEQGRPRAVQQVLPGLHAQAMGAGPVRARRQRHGARADPHQPRRPIFRRYLPSDPAARLHAHVRVDAGPSEHQGDAEYRLPRGCRPDPVASHDLHGADRRLLQLQVRQAALPQLDASSTLRYRKTVFSRWAPSIIPTTMDTHASPSSSTSLARFIRAPRLCTNTLAPTATLTTRCRGRRTQRCTGRYEAEAEAVENVTFIGPARDLQVLQHGPSGRSGARRPSNVCDVATNVSWRTVRPLVPRTCTESTA